MSAILTLSTPFWGCLAVRAPGNRSAGPASVLCGAKHSKFEWVFWGMGVPLTLKIPCDTTEIADSGEGKTRCRSECRANAFRRTQPAHRACCHAGASTLATQGKGECTRPRSLIINEGRLGRRSTELLQVCRCPLILRHEALCASHTQSPTLPSLSPKSA